MDDRIERLARKGQRMRRDGEVRKAALAYGELTAADPSTPRWWVLLAMAQWALRRPEEARKSFRQAAYLFRQSGDSAREAVVRGLLDRLEADGDRCPCARAA
ncbi:MAG: hypothetical protein HY909_28880 [Deltaproteobacteria bacterium]|nr:hypothetical protein [Deltaproteobacteria bacterium]